MTMQSALITGTSSSIGEAAAQYFRKRGGHVYAADRYAERPGRSPEKILISNDREDEAIASPVNRNNSRYPTPSARCFEIINLLLNDRNYNVLRRRAFAAYIQSS
jgi:NAD(P)-dependent dehydrogenase (short-subunit alcohol dehydrogenase family)